MKEMLIRALGWKDPLEKGMATHFSILAWRIPWTEEPSRLQSVGVTKSRTPITELVMPSNHLILYWPLLLLPSIFASMRGFSNESALHIRWPKYWTFSISPLVNIQGRFSLGLTGLISFQSKGLSRVFSSTTVQKHQFFGPQSHLRQLTYDKLIFFCKLC